jgi:hypothetical protein
MRKHPLLDAFTQAILTRVLLIACAALLAVGVAACSGCGQLQAIGSALKPANLQPHVIELQHDLEETQKLSSDAGDVLETAREAAATQPGNEQLATIAAAAERVKSKYDAKVERISGALQKLNQDLATADQNDPAAGLEAIGKTAQGFGGFAGMAGGALLIGASVWKAARSSSLLKRVVTSIEAAKRDGVVDFNDPDVQLVLAAVQGKAGMDAVNKAQKELPKVPGKLDPEATVQLGPS